MPYEVKTPVLAEGIESLRKVRSGLWNGTLETKEANSLIATEDKIRKLVETDIRAREERHER